MAENMLWKTRYTFCAGIGWMVSAGRRTVSTGRKLWWIYSAGKWCGHDSIVGERVWCLSGAGTGRGRKRPVSVKTLRQNRRFSTVWQKEKTGGCWGNIWVSPYCIHCYRKISGTVDAEAGSKVYLPASGYQSQCISDSKWFLWRDDYCVGTVDRTGFEGTADGPGTGGCIVASM